MSQKTRTVSARSFFAPRGALSEWHPNYEFRPGQLEMAEAVEAAIAERKHLLVEAGTGTGKSLAYLVPAILSGKRVVRGDEATLANVGARASGYDFAFDHDRSGGMIRVTSFGFPTQFAGASIEAHDIPVGSRIQHHILIDR